MPACRSDIVGSLLRPAFLQEARQRYEVGALNAAALKKIEDRAVEVEELLAGGAPGIHLYTMNRSHATQRIFEHLRESKVKELLPTAAVA